MLQWEKCHKMLSRDCVSDLNFSCGEWKLSKSGWLWCYVNWFDKLGWFQAIGFWKGAVLQSFWTTAQPRCYTCSHILTDKHAVQKGQLLHTIRYTCHTWDISTSEWTITGWESWDINIMTWPFFIVRDSCCRSAGNSSSAMMRLQRPPACRRSRSHQQPS